MRPPFLPLLFAAAVTAALSACNAHPTARADAASGTPAHAPAGKNGGEPGGAGLSAAIDSARQSADKMDALQALPLLSDDAVRQLLPAALAGRARGPVELTKAMGTCASADYAKAGGAIHVDLTDCAGEAGVGKYAIGYDNLLAAPDTPPAGPGTAAVSTQKKVAFGGGQAITGHDPVNDVYAVTFLGKDRLLVSLSGAKGVSLAELLAFAAALNARF